MAANEAALSSAVQTAFPGAAISLLGCGGFACTFRVQDGSDDLAVKVIDPHQVSNPLREEREVLALRTVNHENVVRYRGTGVVADGGVSYRFLQMDFVEGRSLRELFTSGHSFSNPELATLTEDLANGAVAIWAAGLAHRDLSPNNVMIKPDGRAVIVDLGLARHLSLPTLTTHLPTPGTPGWMSPEQVDAEPERGDWQSDQFVIGLLLYRAATGVEPFSGANFFELWRAPCDRSPLPPRFLNPSLPRRAALFIQQLTRREAHARYMNPQDLLEDAALAAHELRTGQALPAPTRPLRFLLALGETKNYLDDSFFDALAPDGLIIDARGVTPGDVATWINRADQRNVASMIDPDNYLDQAPPNARPAHYLRLPYASDATPAIAGRFPDDTQREAYARPIIDYQLAAGASAVLAPYFYADTGQSERIDESLRLGVVTKRLLLGSGHPHPTWSVIAVADSWLRQSYLHQLLALLAHHRPEVLYLLAATNQSRAQPCADDEVLRGMRSVIEQVNDQGGEVVAGRRYNSGLILGVVGAAGWSTGYEGTLQNLQPPPTGTDEGGGGPGAEWYYAPRLLNSVKVATRAALVGAHGAIFAPTDPYDQALFGANPGLADISTTADRRLLHQHNLFALRQQAAALSALSASERLRTMRGWVQAARTNYNTISAAWDPGEDPAFLDAWQAIL
jgi:serine/threonine protein kinase